MNRLLAYLPYPPFATSLAGRSAFTWFCLRAFLAMPPAGLIILSPGAGVLVVVTVTAAVWLDSRRANEHVFHANLGTSPVWVIAIAAAMALALETAVQVLTRSPAHM